MATEIRRTDLTQDDLIDGLEALGRLVAENLAQAQQRLDAAAVALAKLKEMRRDEN